LNARSASRSVSSAPALRVRLRHVRFAPKADKQADVSLSPLCANRVLTRRSKKARLFDHLVGHREHRWWNFEAERISRLQINNELELGRLLDR